MRGSYANLLFPVKLTFELSYRIPPPLEGKVIRGSHVLAPFGNKVVTGLVTKVFDTPPDFQGLIKDITDIAGTGRVSEKEIAFIEWMAQYYMCTPGEVLKAAVGNSIDVTPPKRSNKKKETSKLVNETKNCIKTGRLTREQTYVLDCCRKNIKANIPTLIKGVTGSGKTEIYMELAKEQLSQGKSVLYMVPEIALSKQLTDRLMEHFGRHLLVFHSKMTPAARKKVRESIRNHQEPSIILGLRSSLFLPFDELGLIVVDEEHDNSYKQSDPAPRYNGRDAALMLARIHGAGIVLGSATPSLESIYNCHSGRFSLVELNHKYHSAGTTTTEVIDTIREGQKGSMEGLFSRRTLDAIGQRLQKNEQVLVFRNRRSYSPLVQCMYCGDIPYCNNCNVSLNYHKKRSILKCHYCEYAIRYNTICTKCGRPGLKERGCGTEMIEEQLRMFFPGSKVARFDAETTSSKVNEEKLLSDFAAGNTDILVGTQMISKGFDFERLTLIVLVQADSMFSTDDFRASEKAMQLLVQLAGRSGRRDTRGHIIVQTARPDNQVYIDFLEGEDGMARELQERKEFGYPPFVRLVRISVKHPSKERVEGFCDIIARKLPEWGVIDFTGPVPPPVERVKREYILNFWVKLKRNTDSPTIKSTIFAGIESLVREAGRGVSVGFDPDPL